MPILIDSLIHTQMEINGKWYIAKPIVAPFIVRLKNAIWVLVGKAEAVTFYNKHA